jgi:hypothetical protein
MSVSKKKLKRSWPWHLPGESLRVWRKRATRVLEELRTKLAKTDAELQAEQEEVRKAAWEADRKPHEERMAGFQFTSSVTPEQRAEQAQQEAKHLRQSEIDRIEEREAERKVALEIINAGFRALSARHRGPWVSPRVAPLPIEKPSGINGLSGGTGETSAVMRSRKRQSTRRNSPPAPVSCGSSPSRHAPSTRTPIYAASPRASAAALRMAAMLAR